MHFWKGKSEILINWAGGQVGGIEVNRGKVAERLLFG